MAHPSLSFSDNYRSGDFEIAVHLNGRCRDVAYIVRFDLIVAFRAYIEGMEPDDFSSLTFSRESCCYVTDESSWKQEFTSNLWYIEESFGKRSKELQHFIVLGGDWSVEILAFEPSIQQNTF